MKKTISGIMAGILVSIGGCVYLSCENRYVGAVMFCVALLSICTQGYALFTGKVGYIALKHGREEVSVLFTALLGNLIGTVACGLAAAYAVPAMGPAAQKLCDAKLTQTFFQTLIRAAFCGILMYLAVNIYRDNKQLAGIFFCVPVFILSGFEHSIANMFYFAAAGMASLRVVGYLLTVILGNAIGGMLLPVLKEIGKEE